MRRGLRPGGVAEVIPEEILKTSVLAAASAGVTAQLNAREEPGALSAGQAWENGGPVA